MQLDVAVDLELLEIDRVVRKNQVGLAAAGQQIARFTPADREVGDPFDGRLRATRPALEAFGQQFLRCLDAGDPVGAAANDSLHAAVRCKGARRQYLCAVVRQERGQGRKRPAQPQHHGALVGTNCLDGRIAQHARVFARALQCCDHVCGLHRVAIMKKRAWPKMEGPGQLIR